MFHQPSHIDFQLPDWIKEFSQDYVASRILTERMKFVIAASEKNVKKGTGGPFSAAVFEVDSGELVSLGVNLVTTQGMSMLHAEMVAIALAQKKLGNYDLGAMDMPKHELVISAEPCAMCFGAIPWSGVWHVATAALGKDARAIGFDEGSKPEDWVNELESRNIKVSTLVESQAAREVLQLYNQLGGHVYNSRES